MPLSIEVYFPNSKTQKMKKKLNREVALLSHLYASINGLSGLYDNGELYFVVPENTIGKVIKDNDNGTCDVEFVIKGDGFNASYELKFVKTISYDFLCEKTELNPGDRVTFLMTNENGIVKSIADDGVFVVFNCDNDWDNYMDYTASFCLIGTLKKGWT